MTRELAIFVSGALVVALVWLIESIGRKARERKDRY